MHLPILDRALWVAGFIENAALLLVLMVRRRWRTFPVFTAFIGFEVVRTIMLYSVDRGASTHGYFFVYWCTECVDLLLQTAVAFEMARIVIKSTGTWVSDARRMFLMMAIAGLIVAAGMAYMLSPSIPKSLNMWIEKGNLFSATLILELSFAVMFASTQLGLVWRNHIMGLATGWAGWVIVAFFTEGAYSYFGQDWHGIVLDRIRILSYQFATIYWVIIFWLPEPKSRTLTPAMQSYLFELHQQTHDRAQDLKKIQNR